MKKTLFLFFLILIATPAFTQVAGSTVYNFLDVPLSARVSALGGNVIAVKDNDINVAIMNPSLLSDSMNNNIGLSYINYLGNVQYGYVTYARHFNNIGNFSAGINYLDYGKMTRADDIGNTFGTFGANEMSVNLSYEHPILQVLDSNITFGATMKTIYSHYDSYISWGSAADMGVTYLDPKSNFAVAAVAKNMGTQWRTYTSGDHEKLPFDAQIGLSKRLKHVPFRLDLVYQSLEKWDLTYVDPNNPTATVDPLTGAPIKQNKGKIFADKLMRHFVIGGEFIITKNIFLRLGYNYERFKELAVSQKRALDGFSFGFGFRVYKFHFSYGRATYFMGYSSNNITISFDMNSF